MDDFRKALAPPAPVEASGSERESVAERVEALIDRIDDITDERHFPAFLLETAWELQRLAREEILPLLSRPQPSGETREVAFLLDRLADFENDINERDWHGHVAPAVARVKDALSTTPARAEAQDEGAAGATAAGSRWAMAASKRG